MKKNTIIASAILLLVINVLALTNPSDLDHKNHVKDIVSAKMGQLTDSSDKENIFSTLFVTLGTVVIDKMVDNFISRDNYVLFSFTTVKTEGEEKNIALGVLGNIYNFEEFDDKINALSKK